MIGDTLSHYRITGKLGEGGMGVVYRATDIKLDRDVALKLLSAHLASDEDARRRFLREAKAAAALDHSNICMVYEVDEVDGQGLLAMQLIEGPTVKEKIAERPLKLDEALDIAIQTGRGLQAAHEKGVVHRDIKSANLMVTPDGQVKIMDFGLARLADHTQITKTAAILGTPAYMSPEQAQGQSADHRSDIFSLGVVLYEMVTGRLPFTGENDQSVLYAIINQEPEPPTALRTGLPTELDRIILKALAKDPAERYQHIEELGGDLKALSRRADARSASAVRSPQQSRSSTVSLAVAAAGLVALSAGLTWWFGVRSRTTSAPTVPTLIKRLTSDSGLTYQPAISRDGTLFAYASDRSGEGDLDIWVQQVGGGEPIRLTTHDADDSEPNFSPDGKTIAFRSERDGGGIYAVPTLGGDARLIAPKGSRPRFSPEGQWIAYHVRRGRYASQEASYVVPSSGGAAEAELAGSDPIWSPKGSSLLVRTLGDRQWRIDSFPAGASNPTAAVAILEETLEPPRGYSGGATIGGYGFVPEQWTEDGFVYFSAQRGDSIDVWKIRLEFDGRVATGPERVTFGPGIEQGVSAAADGRILFADLAVNEDIWSLPLDANRGVVTGDMLRLTSGISFEDLPDISDDGKKLVFRSDRTGRPEQWILDLENGKQRSVAPIETGFRATISPDGAWVAFEAVRADRTIHILRSEGGAPTRTLTDATAPWGWSSKSEYLLFHHREPGLPNGMDLLNAQSGTITDLIVAERGVPNQGQFSPDDRWIAFWLGGNLFITPFRGEQPVPRSEWISVTDSEFFEDKPRWSPDGNLLYFTSDRDGSVCIYAQRLDPGTKRPIGAPLAVYHSHRRNLSLANVASGALEIDVARDKLVFGMGEWTANIWMMEPAAE